jgi:glycosyltransferase involved in cell wall biosynthesis
LPKLMRVLYFADIRFPLERANGIQTMETCAALAERGHDVRLIVRPDTHRPARDPLAYYDLPGAPRLTIEHVPAIGPRGMRRALYLARAVGRVTGKRRADVAFTRDLGVAAALLRLPRRLRPPVVYESHGFSPTVRAARPVLLGTGGPVGELTLDRLWRCERRVWRAADGYVTITATLGREMAERFGDRPDVAIVPDGVRLDPARRWVSRPAGAPATVGYAGHLYPWKGADVLLEALATLPATRGLIVGGHPAERDLDRTRALAVRLGISDRVEFTGLVAPGQVRVRLSETDVLVVPNPASAISAYTSPLKVFEYMAAGRPIIAADLPALREVLRNGENALLVEPGSAAALAGGIRRLLDDRATAERLARRAFADVVDYGWNSRAARLEMVFGPITNA